MCNLGEFNKLVKLFFLLTNKSKITKTCLLQLMSLGFLSKRKHNLKGGFQLEEMQTMETNFQQIIERENLKELNTHRHTRIQKKKSREIR